MTIEQCYYLYISKFSLFLIFYFINLLFYTFLRDSKAFMVFYLYQQYVFPELTLK